MRQLATRRFSDNEVQKAFDELSQLWSDACVAGLFFVGKETSLLALTTATTTVFHGLGKVPTRVFPVWMDANVTVKVVPGVSDPLNYVLVAASAGANVRLHIS